METFLTRDEVAELTGRKQRGKQIEQLSRMKILYIPDALGWPKVLRKTIEEELCIKTRSSSAANKTINYKSLESVGHR